MTTEYHHPLHAIPHDLVGRAIKDPNFRAEVIRRASARTELNQYLEEMGYAPIGEEAFDAIKRLDIDDVNDALSKVDRSGLEFLAS
jgi:hypothetical protein